jgi:hypothetical protein
MLAVMDAATPEELETMLEDAFLSWDRSVLRDLFEEGAVVLAQPERRPARGIEEVTSRVVGMWERGRTVVGGAGTILRTGDTALALGADALSVMRRGGDCRWRYSIFVFSPYLPRGEAWTPDGARRR